MRNMSFALTTDQMIEGTKDVTRRLGWLKLAPGEWIRPVKKCMGLKPGETVQPLRAPVKAIGVRREPLRRLIDEPDYGRDECRREGFPNLTPEQFVAMFCSTHRDCTPDTTITRIEFAYEAPPAGHDARS